MNDIHLWPANRVTSGSKIWAVVLSVHKESQTMATVALFTAGNWGLPMTVVLISDFDVN